MTVDEMLAELRGAETAWPRVLLAEATQLAEEGRGLGRDNAAARVYGPASGRGTLGDSVRGRAQAVAEGVTVELTVGEPGTPAAAYARAQELGARGAYAIRPRRSRYLAIPTDAAVRGGLRSPRQVAEPEFRPRRGGGWLVFGLGVLLFVLHPGPVELAPKRFLGDAFDDVVRVTPARLPLAALMGFA
jgi:hypothetical protein